MTFLSIRRWLPGMRPPARAVAGVAVAVLAAGGGGLAWASIPDGSGVFHACLAKSGLVRVINAPADACRKGETPISWNQRGPAGPQGPSGPTGAAGPAGAPGAGSIAATAGTPGPVFEPAARVIPAGGGNDAYPVLTVPFTLTTAGFVHMMAYGELAVSSDATCDGSPLADADSVEFVIDGNINGYPGAFANAAAGASGKGTSATDAWLAAGPHTLFILYIATGCNATASGTATITNLHVEAIAY